MNLDYVDGLLFSSVFIKHNGKTILVPHIVIDTGAAESIISIDAVEELFNTYEPEDQIRFMTGIGGREASVRRRIDQVEFHSYKAQDIRIDFGRIGEYSGINGLIGLDILIPGKFIVDLHRLRLYFEE
ncbi:retropepsin-like aspartic protease [Cohnella silvisoli]|uniref:Retropepsin-like aspartic protease n=1 Tax=Cohnella silvisoli TaxID=2873699 RepID=A0ABV1KWE6_9BACL|nr:retropepsin-like aspartic protease [Cohnella silvisoli]MCD9024020.1 retropepsin-like domain-containing protein [Cohnella silvisoli]